MEDLFYAVADENGFGVYHHREDASRDLGSLAHYHVHGLHDYDEAKLYAVNAYIEISGDMIDVDYAINMMRLGDFYHQEYEDDDTMFESDLLYEDLFILLLLLTRD